MVRTAVARLVEDDEAGWGSAQQPGARIWDDVQRYWAEEAEEPLGPAPSGRQEVPRDESDPPTAVVAGAWITITLDFVGAMTAALTVAIATALGWALWHNWPRLSRLWQVKQSLGARYAAARRTSRIGERPTVLIRAPAGHVDAPIPAA